MSFLRLLNYEHNKLSFDKLTTLQLIGGGTGAEELELQGELGCG